MRNKGKSIPGKVQTSDSKEKNCFGIQKYTKSKSDIKVLKLQLTGSQLYFKYYASKKKSKNNFDMIFRCKQRFIHHRPDMY